MKKALISGVSGQDGSYLAELLLEKGYEVHGVTRRVSVDSRFRMERLDHIMHRLHMISASVENYASIFNAIESVQPDEIYHLAAQSFVQDSFKDEFTTMRDNVDGTHNVLSIVKTHHPKCRLYFAGSSEMFGKVLETPQREQTPFNPRSIYGISKCAGAQMVKHYRDAYGIHASCGILFNHECLTEETPIIFRKNGWIDIAEIQELVPHRANPEKGKKYQTIPKSMEIWDGVKWSAVTLATATWNGGEKDVYRVEARGGLYCATADHKSFLDGRREVDTKDIKKGDLVQLYAPPNGSMSALITSEEAEFLGLMTGDGYICPEGGSARFTNLNNDLLDRCASLYTRITGGKSRVDKTKRSGYTGGVVPSVEFSGAIQFFKLWRSEIYNERGMKKVPKRILNAPPDIQMAFMSGYNSADGLKSKTCRAEFKCWVTNSSILAAGLWSLAEQAGLRVAMNWDERGYIRLNIGDVKPERGAHLLKPLNEVKTCKKIDHKGWLFDLATESGTFSAGVGRTWVHNSPRRGVEFVTRKVCRYAARIKHGLEKELPIGNLEARRDWGHAGDYVRAMYLMLQQEVADDYVVATGITKSVHELCQKAFDCVGLNCDDWIKQDENCFRPSEVDLLLGDSSKARMVLGWEPEIGFDQLIEEMVESELKLIK